MTAEGDRLRRAADRLDELDRAATGGPWAHKMQGPADWWLHVAEGYPVDTGRVAYVGVGSVFAPTDAALIVALRLVAAPLAAWLRVVSFAHHPVRLAHLGGGDVICATCHSQPRRQDDPVWPCPTVAGALDVADAINGKDEG